MTNQDVINFLNQVRKILLDDKSWSESTTQPINEAFDKSISALQAQDSPKPIAESAQNVQSEDLISRKAAIDELEEHRALFCDHTPETFRCLSYGDKCRVDEIDMAIATLMNLPSAQPELSKNYPKLDKENGDLQPTCNQLATDCISRQAVIDVCDIAIDLWHGQLGEGIVIAVKKKIEELRKVLDAYLADGCCGCKYEDTEEWLLPCMACKRNRKDFWRASND